MSLLSPYAVRGDKARHKLDALQDRIDSLLVERAQVAGAPVSTSDFKSRIRRGLESGSMLAERADAQFVPTPPWSFVSREPLTVADLAWLFGIEEVTERVAAASAAYLVGRPVQIEAAARNARLNAIDQELEVLQQDEERQVLALFDAGIKVLRREGADPGVLLAAWQKEG